YSGPFLITNKLKDNLFEAISEKMEKQTFHASRLIRYFPQKTNENAATTQPPVAYSGLSVLPN
ncbi:hypothetical protein BB561_005114, partial [Smittium simulii]